MRTAQWNGKDAFGKDAMGRSAHSAEIRIGQKCALGRSAHWAELRIGQNCALSRAAHWAELRIGQSCAFGRDSFGRDHSAKQRGQAGHLERMLEQLKARSLQQEEQFVSCEPRCIA
eukprot:1206696-Pleurochrysis_carterae.AAC.3